MRILFITIFFLFINLAQAQNLVFKASFDDGSANDNFGKVGIPVGTTPVCGLDDGLAREFRGGGSITYPSAVNRLLESEFTLSFYLQIENDVTVEDGVNIISIRNECGVRDSSFFINYYPVAEKIIVDYWKDEDLTRVESKLDISDCWHHIVLVNSIAELKLYVNGILKNTVANLQKPFVLDSTAMFGVSASPCIGAAAGPEVRLEGTIDELCIFDLDMDERQVQALYIQPDKILTQDTSIFMGGSVAIQTLESCAGDLNWFPTTGVSPVGSTDPVITPDQTTTYELELDYGFCKTTDSITITVIDPSQVDCEEVSIPTAFTPNDDFLNDDLGISNPILIEDLKSFEIYDKWGGKMFETQDKNSAWDGYFRGEIPNTNTFMYRINYNCKGQEYFKSGSFTILR